MGMRHAGIYGGLNSKLWLISCLLEPLLQRSELRDHPQKPPKQPFSKKLCISCIYLHVHMCICVYHVYIYIHTHLRIRMTTDKLPERVSEFRPLQQQHAVSKNGGEEAGTGAGTVTCRRCRPSRACVFL